MFDTILAEGTVVNPFGKGILDVGIKDGKVVALAKSGTLTSSCKRINAAGMLVIPGLIDAHVHLGLVNEFSDDCFTETRAAAAGGVTTVLSHAICKGNIMAELEKMIRLIEEQSHIQVGLHFGMIAAEQIDLLNELFLVGITSFKFFMGYKGEDSRRIGVGHADDGFLFEAFEKVAGKGGVCMVHAENWDLIQVLLPRCKGDKGLIGWAKARPDFSEAESISRAAFWAKIAGCELGVVHVSSKLGVEAIKNAKMNGAKIYGEACPQYLSIDCLGEDLVEPLTAKITPPVRTIDDIDALWKGIMQRNVTTSGTDHCALVKKDKVGGDIWSTRPGFPGLETFLPIMYTKGVLGGHITLEELVDLTSHQNALTYGLSGKGCILPGYDADIVVVNPNVRKTVSAKGLKTSSDFTPYEGWALSGWPSLTMVRGVVVMEDGELKDRQGAYIFRK